MRTGKKSHQLEEVQDSIQCLEVRGMVLVEGLGEGEGWVVGEEVMVALVQEVE